MSIFRVYSDGDAGYFLVYKSDEPENGAIVSPHLKMEANKAASFEFTIYPENAAYDTFDKMKTFVYVKRDSKYIFRGRVSDVKTDIFKQRTITCEGDLGFLADSIQSPNTFVTISTVGNTKKKKKTKSTSVKMTLSAYFNSVITTHNTQMTDGRKQFTVGTVSVSGYNNQETFELSSYKDTASVISSDLLSVYGGVIRTRYENDVAYIDWLDEYTDTNSQSVNFGVNMIEMDEEPQDGKVWSVLLPIGENNLDISSVNSNSKFLENANMIQKYGRIVHYHKFNNVKKASDLKSKAQKYMSTHCKIYQDNITVKAIDLELIGESNDPLELGDKIRVVSSPHGINRTLACIEMELDIQNPENNSYTIGTIMPPDKEKKKASLSSRHSSARRSSSSNYNSTSTALDSLAQDMDAISNNVNVNAENIAITARDIAIVAENLAVVAHNLTIEADNIDVHAQTITEQLSDETGNLTTTITRTGGDIKTEMTNKTEHLEGVIEASAAGITATFNRTIFGENGTFNDPTGNSVVAKFRAEYTATATEFKNVLFGEGADINDKTTWTSTSELKQTATEISLRVKAGDIASSINQTAQSVRISAQKIDLDGYVSVQDLTTTNGNIENLTSRVSSIETAIASSFVATNIKGTSSVAIGDNNNAASLTYRGGKYTSVNFKMTGISLGSHSLVLGYTTNDSTSATGNEVDLTHAHSLSFSNSNKTITVGGPAGTNSGTSFTASNLSHSHQMMVGNDGTITVGVPLVDSQGSFRIADTKTYKDGVSAAVSSVTVDTLGRRTTSSGVIVAATYEDPSEDYVYGRYSIPIYAEASNNASRSENVHLIPETAYREGRSEGRDSVTIDDLYEGTIGYNENTNVYSVPVTAAASNGDIRRYTVTFIATRAMEIGEAAGASGVTITTLRRRLDGNNEPIAPTYSRSTGEYTIKIHAGASNNAYKNAEITISGSDAYTHGHDDGASEGAEYYRDLGHKDMIVKNATSVSLTNIQYHENYKTYSFDMNITVETKNGVTPGYLKTFTIGYGGLSANNGSDSAYQHGYRVGYAKGLTEGKNSVSPRTDITIDNITIQKSRQKAQVLVQFTGYSGSGTTPEWNHSVDWSKVTITS